MKFSDHAKLATCSYCDTRAVLKLADFDRHHELSCGACGAPLHVMKPLKISQPKPKPAPLNYDGPSYKPKKKRTKKRRRSVIDWDDLFEDFFDELFD